jgi:hypothetical protein
MEYNRRVHDLFVSFEKAYESIRTDKIYGILTEKVTHIKLVRLIKMCFSEAYKNFA